MKKLILWLFVLLILVFSVDALEVQLVSPLEGTYQSTIDSVTFKCSIIGTPAIRLQLYTNLNGLWQQSGNNCNDQTNCTFVINGFTNGNYKWNCLANGWAWAPINRTLIFSLSNDPPIFNGTIPSQTWDKNTVLSDIFDLNNFFSDPTDTLIYTSSGNDKITVNIVNSIVTLTPFLNWVGSETVVFTANDGKGGTVNSNNIVLTVTGDGTPVTEDCGDDIDNDNDGLIDCQDSDCSSSENNCQDVTCNNSTYDWEYTIKSDADCDSDSDCSSDNCDLSDCVCVEESSEEEEFEEEEESGLYIIKSYSPLSNKINMNLNASKTFKVTPSEDAGVGWYLDGKKIGDGENYKFKAEEEGVFELVAVIGNNPTLKNNDDFLMWTVHVGETAIKGALCGNNKIDSGENCETCAKDVICAEGEKCVKGECVVSKGFFSSVSGYAVKTKDFVVEKWKYSSIIGGIIIVLVVVGIIYTGKRRKKDVLHEFGRESFFSKFGKLFKSKEKKGYVTKKVEEKPTVEKQREVFVDKNPFTDDKKL